MATPDSVTELIERFERNRDAYLSGAYNEFQLRKEFLDPLFETLGWDMQNKLGYAEAYKDVIHEDAIKVGGFTKAPDYCFRIGGTRKFFVEAKKPSVNLKDDISPAFQLRRYAWSAKLPLSILSDFEELAVYDCRIKPVKTDKASTARVLYLTYEQYGDKWDNIVSIFSRDAILKGSFDKYVESTKGKKGTAEVDLAFLKEIETWRDSLARNLALRNLGLSQRELNYAVQTIIDRIIFLRICEDRGIEDYGRLMALRNGDNVYRRMFELFERADERYNSGLFHFRDEKDRNELPDLLTPTLAIDDKQLKDIIKNLYYPDSAYEFSVLPADILGQVYEQFLGKVIRLTAGHRAVVEDKPEVKKAGGVYYTPTYIVDYIVKNTVGKLLEGKTPKRASELRILDPACGSGSFLIGAYQYLLDWHRDWYVNHGIAKHTKEVYQGPAGEWRLTTAERKRILLNNIYGVDIDAQAVEVTKLSLLLKVLEGESDETLSKQLQLFHERALPDLSDNVKCGNSIIGSDFYDNQQLTLLDDEDRYKINAFDWKSEFPSIMGAGGFDAVIGNPPYVRQETIGNLKDYFQRHYDVYHGVADLYVYFIERGVSLLANNGYFGFIVASKWMQSRYGERLRRWVKSLNIVEIVDFGALAIFQKATTYTCVFIIQNKSPDAGFKVTKVNSLDSVDLEEYVSQYSFYLNKDSLEDKGWSLIDSHASTLLEKIRTQGISLKQYVDSNIYYGIKTGLNEAFVIDEKTREGLVAEDKGCVSIIKPFLVGKDIKRYQQPRSNRYVIFTRRRTDISAYPAIEKYLEKYKTKLLPKPPEWKGSKWSGRKPGSYKWFEIQDTVDYFKVFDEVKIMWPGISAEVTSFALDEFGYYGNDNTQSIVSSEKYLLGILNSKLSKFFLMNICDKVQGGFYRLKISYIQQIPIKEVNNDKDEELRNELTSLVEHILELNVKLANAETPDSSTVLNRQIATMSKRIDLLVYELYSLTDEEIRIVEQEQK